MDAIVLPGGNPWPTVFLSYASKGFLFDFKLLSIKSEDGGINLRIPEIDEIGIDNIDYVLISSFESFTALPYLVNNSKFQGKIYASVPTIDLGRNNITGEKLFPVTSNGVYLPIYNDHAIEECIRKITPVRYSEIIKIDKSTDICAASSGYCIGSSNWVLRTPEQKVIYVSISSDNPLAPPMAFDAKTLMNADFLFAPNIPHYVKNPIDETVRNMSLAFSNAFSRNGDVLIPVNPVENVYELISLTHMALSFSGYPHIPIHFVSPVAKSSLHLSNVVGEWMNPEFQKKIYDTKYPLIHGQLISEKLLYHHEYLYDVFKYPKPHLILAAHIEFKYGEAMQVLNVWKYTPDNVLILLDCPEPNLDSDHNIETLHLSTKETLSITEIVARTSPKALACIDNAYNRSHLLNFPKDTYFVPVSLPMKFDFKQKFVGALITEKSLKSMEINDSCSVPSPLGNRLYPIMFSGNFMIPSSLKNTDQNVNFILRLKTNNSKINSAPSSITSDVLATKYSSCIPDTSIHSNDSQNVSISWKTHSKIVSIVTNELDEVETLVSSSEPHLINKFNKVIDDYVCEKDLSE